MNDEESRIRPDAPLPLDIALPRRWLTEKQVVKLPDGRELTYYRFPDPPPAPPRSGRPEDR